MLKNSQNHFYKNKKLYFLIMTFGVMIDICLFFAFKRYNMFQLNDKELWESPMILQIIIYFVIITGLNDFYQYCFANPTQEKISLHFGKILGTETLIFDSKLSDNPQIYDKQKNLSNKKQSSKK